MTRLEFLKSATAAGAAACTANAFCAEAPALRVGFLSDTHVTRAKASAERVRQALALFRAHGVDMVAHVGDLADWHYPEAYGHYRAAVDEFYPPTARRPVFLYAFGDHDALDPARQKGPREKRTGDRRRAFADMQARLGIDHDYHDLKVVAGYPFLVFPQCLDGDVDLAAYERKIAETCARFPDRPVFVLEHPPAFNTTYNSQFESRARRAVLDKFPRVVEISGHKHASVNNEACIWQGAFTAVQTSCLQKWYGLNVGERVLGKESFGVIVMEVFPDRLVFRRFDVGDASEYRLDDPWTVALPYAASSAARYAPAVRARNEKPAAFAPGAEDRIAVVPDAAAFSSVTVRFPTVADPDRVLRYRVEPARRNARGEWERFSCLDVFGDFYRRAALRTGMLECRFLSSLFEAETDYRFFVTPIGFFGARGPTLCRDWRSGGKAPAEVVWRCDDPMASLRATGSAKPRREGDWYACGPGELRLSPPAGTIVGKKGERFRFTVEAHFVQKDAPFGVAFGVTRASWAGGLLTPSGDMGVRRYVLEEKYGEAAKDWAFKFGGSNGLRVCFKKLLVEKIPAPSRA